MAAIYQSASSRLIRPNTLRIYATLKSSQRLSSAANGYRQLNALHAAIPAASRAVQTPVLTSRGFQTSAIARQQKGSASDEKQAAAAPTSPSPLNAFKSTTSSHLSSFSTSSRLHQRSRGQSVSSPLSPGASASLFQTPSQSNDFPVFSDSGDVEIVIASPRSSSRAEHRYLLHQLILSQCSSFFRASLSDAGLHDIDESPVPQHSHARSHAHSHSHSQSHSQSGSARRVSRPEQLPFAPSALEAGKCGGDGPAVLQRESSWRFRRRRTKSNPEDLFNSLPVRGTYRKKTRWRFELDWESCKGDEIPVLVQRVPQQRPSSISLPLFVDETHIPHPNTSTKPHTPRRGFFRTIAKLTSFYDSSPDLKRAAAADAAAATTSVSAGSDAGATGTYSGGSYRANDGRAIDPTLRDYDNLFRTFYNHPPRLNAEHIGTAYQECKSLLHLADMYDALPIVAPRVDHHLLRFSSRLFKHISEHPLSYLKLGYLARSKVIFREAMIHLVGQWPEATVPSHRTRLPAEVLDLISLKVGDLGEAIMRAENRLLSLTLATSVSAAADVNPSLDFLAESVFRQWLVQSLRPPRDGQDQPVSSAEQRQQQQQQQQISLLNEEMPVHFSAAGRTFRLLAAPGPECYLGRKELKQFLKHFGAKTSSSQGPFHGREQLHHFQERVGRLRHEAREIVMPLTHSHLEMDANVTKDGGSCWPYLTCTVIDDVDLPWISHHGSTLRS
ncbi:hypothetical protein KEM56_001224 [Ascosphaera pollenicola]|nr:hypothetical protein KEM56_001224 [Ascosphaera pollenicola]